jgi:hypothetical protein
MGTPIFEHATCGRCGGSGKYSFNMMDGTRCYGCNGAGYVLTKRGAAAQAFLNALRSKPVEELKVGDMVYVDMSFMKPCFLVIESMRRDELNISRENWILSFVGRKDVAWTITYGYGHKMRLGFTAEEKAVQVKAALEFQATLTKAGVPSKRK